MSSDSIVPVDAQVLLFPLCDCRGMLTRLLLSDAIEPKTEVESLFFAWLLDLPAHVEPADAAHALFTTVQAARRRRDRHSADKPSVELTLARQKLYRLLADLCRPESGNPDATSKKRPGTTAARTFKNARH